jgi:RHS repeat-associated protein
MYGPGETTIEQISSSGAAIYLHHDQQGSTRLITGATGAVEGKCTYDAYGTPICEGTATTPLGYDAQYTGTDTGLIYERARTYDPATAQFLSVDPLAPITGEPYTDTYGNPVSAVDPTGLCSISPFSSSSCLSDAAGAVKRGVETDVSVVKEGAQATAHLAYEHPVILPALGCTVGMLAGPELCVGAVGGEVGLSTYKNASGYVNGELTGEQVFDKQLLDTALSGLGAAPGLPLLGTAAGELVDGAPAAVQMLVNGSLEFPDAVLSGVEPNISCLLLGVS